MQRHYGMDWLRIGAFALLILYHIGMVFAPWNFHVNRPVAIGWLTIPMQAVNAWRLPLLFVVSGYASRAIFAGDANAGRFAWQRTLRLLVPTLAAIMVVIPPQPWVELTVKHGYPHSYLYFLANDYFRFAPMGGLMLPTWQHLWFVVYLWVYTLGLAAALAVVPPQVRSRLGHLADRALAGPMVLLVPIVLLWVNMAWIFPGAPETHALIDDWSVHRIDLGMFLFGFYLRQSVVAWQAIQRWWKLAAWLAVGSYGLVASVEFATAGMGKLPIWLWAVFCAARMVQGWSAVIALIGVADRYFNRDHRWRVTLNEAIFPFYIVHQTLIVVVAASLWAVGLPAAVEFLVILAATIAGCWAFYLGGRRFRLTRLLIGLRATPPIQPASRRVATVLPA